MFAHKRSASSMVCALLTAGVFTAALSGCGMVSPSNTVVPSANSGSVNVAPSVSGITGSVHGGLQPVVGAYIQLYAVGNSFGAGATPLVPTSTTGTPDGSAQSLVSTNSAGGYSLSGQFTCPAGNPYVYATAVGGNPGVAGGTGVSNTGIAMIAALGQCNSLGSGTKIEINEVTTVATIWALQNFINIPFSNSAKSLWNGGGTCSSPAGLGTTVSPYDCTGAGATTPPTAFNIASSATNTTGLAAAFKTASILANMSTGVSPGSNASGSASNIESWNVNGIANILTYCVNSVSTGAAPGPNCSNSSKNGLLNLVASNATAINYSSGSNPLGGSLAYATYQQTYSAQDTLQAAWLIARNPAYNVSTLFGLISANPAFTGATSFNDFTIGYSIGGTFDGSTTASSTVEGVFPAVPSTATPVPLATPFQVSFDKYGNAFVSNMDLKGSSSTGAAPYNPFITELDATGNYIGLVSGYSNSAGTFTIFGGNANPNSLDSGNANEYLPVVFDNSNHFYVYDQFTGAIAAFNGAGGPGQGVANPATTTVAGNAVTSAPYNNAVNSGITSSTGKSFNNMVYDGNGNLWITSQAAATSGVTPFASNAAGFLYSIPVSDFASTSPTYTGTATALPGAAGWGLMVDNTPASSASGAPFVYLGYAGGCNTPSTGSTLAVANTAYGLVDAFYGTATSAKTVGTATGFSPLLDYNGTSSYFSTSSSCPIPTATTNLSTTALGPVTTTYNGSSVSVVPIASPQNLAVDASNNIWIFNQTTPEVGTSVAYPAYSLTKIPAPTYNATAGITTATFTVPVVNSNGGLLASGTSGGATNASKTFNSWAMAVDGAGSVWLSSNYNLSEFSNNNVALSPANSVSLNGTTFFGFSGGQTSSARRFVGTYKNVAVDRVGNVWIPGSSSNGAQINVIVGAATAVTTPVVPPNQGVLP